MKKRFNYIIILCFIFGISSCVDTNSPNKIESQDNEETASSDSEYSEVPEENQDFEIVKISKSEFNDEGTLEFHFELKNNTENKFSKAWLSAEMKYVLQNGQTCNAVFQYGPNPDINPLPAKDWEPNSIIEYTIISPDHRNVAGCHIDLDRTPTSLTLELTLDAISVDREVKDEVLIVYDLLPVWKEKQTAMGLR